MIFRNESRGTELAHAAGRTKNLIDRLVGLLPRSGLAQGEGLWLVPCRSIHTFGMRFPIDAVFLDRSLRVVGLMERVRPFRLGKLFLKAHSVLELPAGTVAATGTRLGDQLRTVSTAGG